MPPGLLQEAPPISNSLCSLRSSVYADIAKSIRSDGVSINGSFLRAMHDLQSCLSLPSTIKKMTMCRSVVVAYATRHGFTYMYVSSPSTVYRFAHEQRFSNACTCRYVQLQIIVRKKQILFYVKWREQPPLLQTLKLCLAL